MVRWKGGWMDGDLWGRATVQVEEEGERRWPCSLLRCWRNPLVGAPLFTVVLLSAKEFYPVSSFYLSTSLPVVQPLYLSISLSLCWRCSVRVFNEMAAFEVHWWRCERGAIKKLVFKAEGSSASVCLWRAAPKASQLLAAAARGRNREREHDSWALQLKSCVSLSYCTIWNQTQKSLACGSISSWCMKLNKNILSLVLLVISHIVACY